MPKRMLVLADADGLWTRRYIENLLLPDGWTLVLFPIWGEHGVNADFYKQNGVTVYHDGHALPVIRRIPRLRMWARIAANARDLAKLGPFDVVHNIYLSQRDLALGERLRKRFDARWVGSFMGSDLLRSSELAHRRMLPYLERCDAISIQNVADLERAYGERFRAKAYERHFGHNSCAYIDRTRAEMSKAQCRAEFGLDADAVVVCLGSSAAPGQQHLLALDAMARCKRLERVTLVLQLTYGAPSEAYLETVRERAETLGCKLLVLTDYLDDMKSARLRLSADIYIHSVVTDAFSVSMQEYYYAGATVLKGAWLRFPELAQMGITPYEFADFDALAPLLDRAIGGELPPLPQALRAEFPKRFSWDAVREDWLRLYQREQGGSKSPY